ncbi:MAG: hypothetical protein ACFCA4_12450 [Cyanophyceae cyanobacterium]
MEEVHVLTTFIFRRWTDNSTELLHRISRARASLHYYGFDWCAIKDNMAVLAFSENSYWVFLFDWQEADEDQG